MDDTAVLYRHYDADGALLYIGSTATSLFRDRQTDHARDARWWRYVARIDHEPAGADRRSAYLAEFAALRAELPVFNCWARHRPRMQEQLARQEQYLREHPDVPRRWPRARPGMSPVKRRDEIDAMLAELGLSRTTLLRRAQPYLEEKQP